MDIEKLKIWQLAIKLAEDIYKITSKFPKSEKFGIVDQMKRSAISVSSNIAEGRGRNSTNDFVRFLNIARGSLYELQSQSTIAHNVGLMKAEDYKMIKNKIEDLAHKIKGFVDHLQNEEKG
jgi:four helix bundle protein